MLCEIKFSSSVKFKKNFEYKKDFYDIINIRKKEIVPTKKPKVSIIEEIDLSSKNEEKSDNNKRKSNKISPSSSEEKEQELTKKPRQQLDDQNTNKKLEETTDGNMIILSGSDSMWKSNSEKSANMSCDEFKSREDEFENYLEDLLL